MKFTSVVTTNELVVLESLADDEEKTGTFLAQDLESTCRDKKFRLSFGRVDTVDEFRQNMLKLTADAADRGVRPILHLEIHGAEHSPGLVFLPSKEILLWEDFAALTRELNAATLNNLVVVMAVCHGYESILAVKIAELTPFCVLIGPTEAVTNRQIKAAFGAFYRELLDRSDVLKAGEILPDSYLVYDCERIFATGFTKYVRDKCLGAGKQERLDALLAAAAAARPDLDVHRVRKYLEESIGPSERDFQRFRARFLMSDHPDNANRFQLGFEDVLETLGVLPVSGAGPL
jgi:hypothetical protein